MAWKKEKIQEWLTSKNITYGERMLKKQLLELVAPVKSRFLSYIIDNTAVRASCIVHRLLPYHCEFNPIELVWAKVKNGIAAENRDFKQSTVNAILREKIKQVTMEDWRKSIQHVMDLEAKFRLDTSGSKHIQPIVIQLGQTSRRRSSSGSFRTPNVTAPPLPEKFSTVQRCQPLGRKRMAGDEEDPRSSCLEQLQTCIELGMHSRMTSSNKTNPTTRYRS
ncbi:hypothetical protein HPB50_000126 [Hyalomma asiaticum]|uniref:Uncharacterized protein n=1 Tax=Hyalomma asiaticum TaxID=266040 RepID=A0ACB7T8G3_HYAAI|nr:hypothetical protein HPB50_000126 [Hyalomma asiaticum]